MKRCRECIHIEVCLNHHGFMSVTGMESWIGQDCSFFEDESQFIKLPCKVGDSVFTIDKKGKIQECIVINVNCKTQMMLDEKPWIDFIIGTEPVNASLPFPMIFTYSITKNCSLFLTKESAEQALKERENND